ncbi:molybdopterin-binding protein [Acidiplasma cupricumulans]|uniref:molybdopterin-binding protein n=1 Tax=Acidiplasma cupricumulans TaxID=312540 RepID=UPI001585309D|nr:molybdopterin-binding protein [Acidiplasma cupricumulans]
MQFNCNLSGIKKYNSFNVKIYDIVRDSYEELKKVINASVTENDVTITIGSTSAGEMDYVYKIIGEYKPGILFHGVRVKPGKPVYLPRQVKGIFLVCRDFPSRP